MTAAKKRVAKAAEPEMILVDTKRMVVALKQVAGFASRDDTLPMLNAVHVEYHKGELTLVATDRFKLGAVVVSTRPDEDAPAVGDWSTMIALRDVPVITSRLQGEPWFVPVRVRRDVPDIGLDTRTELDIHGVTVGFEAQFPDWRSLVKGAFDTPPADAAAAVMVNPAHVKPFLGMKNVTLRLPASPTAIVLAYSDSFVGIVMPIKPAADVEQLITDTFRLGAA